MRRLLIIPVIGLLIAGCAHVVSRDLREQADPGLPSAMLFKNPGSLTGRTVIIGGTIVESFNTDKGTYIEVVEKPLDHRGRPMPSDKSLGRFLILHEGYLDPAIYSRGRDITVAGEVSGGMTRPLGEINYHYPLIKSSEAHLIKPGYGMPIRLGIGIWGSF